MFIELVDVLRCVQSHEDSWLVLSATSMVDRHVITGELGCPVCRAHYPISSGIAHFAKFAAERCSAALEPPGETAFRLAALLGLTEAGGIVLLAGQHAALGPALGMIAPETQFLCVNPAVPPEMSGLVSGITCDARLPLATSSCRGAAVDVSHAAPPLLVEFARVLKAGGRLVAPREAHLPELTNELARDDAQWVAERTVGGGGLVNIASTRRK